MLKRSEVALLDDIELFYKDVKHGICMDCSILKTNFKSRISYSGVRKRQYINKTGTDSGKREGSEHTGAAVTVPN